MRGNKRFLVGLFGALGVLLGAGTASAQIVGHVDVESRSFTFTDDIICDESPCVSIDFAGARVDGAGHTVDCNGFNTGVSINQPNVSVKNLTVINCGNGFLVFGANARLTNNTANQNQNGFNAQAAGGSYTGNNADDNNVGFFVAAAGNTFRRNSSSSNTGWGFLLDGVSSNSVVGANSALGNTASGISVQDGSVNNTISRNTATGNGQDLQDFNSSTPCDNNVWRGNTFNTANVSCIQ